MRQGCQPLDQRPISVMSAVYRLWGPARVEAMAAWQEQWAHDGQHAYRPEHSTEDVYWQLGLMVENALLHDEPLHGATFDHSSSRIDEHFFCPRVNAQPDAFLHSGLGLGMVDRCCFQR